MLSFHRQLVVISVLFLALTTLPCPASAKGFKKVTSLKGGPPKTVLVESPQDALKFWNNEKVRHRSLLLFNVNLGIAATGEEDSAMLRGGLGKDDWDKVLARNYPTLKTYPVHPFNYLHAAHQAGMIDRIYWVPPAKLSVGVEPLDNFKSFLKDLMVSEEDLAGLKQSGDSIQGTINGVPVYICKLSDLPNIKEEVVAAVDLSYFVPLYQDEVKTPMLDIFGDFMKTLGSKGVHISSVVISRSTGLGLVPLEFRFLDGYLYTYFISPRSIQNGPLRKWKLRSEGMFQETFFQPEEALGIYKKAVKAAPDDASLRYALAIAYFKLNDGDRMKAQLDRAVSLDKGYYTSYIELGSHFITKGYMAASHDFLMEAFKVNPQDPRCLDALYESYKASGDFGGASGIIEKLVAMGYDWPEKLGKLAEAYEKHGLYEKAIDTYKKALSKIPEVDRKARFNLLLGLASAYENGRKIEEALKTYEEALNASDDPHTKEQIRDNKIKDLKEKWEPFMGPKEK